MRLIFYVYLPLALIILSFWFFYSHYEPYEPVGPDLIGGGRVRVDNVDLTQKLCPGQQESPLAGSPYHQWQYSGDVEWDKQGGYSGKGGIRLPGGNKEGSYMAYTINNPRAWKHLKFSGHMRTENVAKGAKKPWQAARLLLFFRDAQNKAYWERPHALVSLYGDHGWKKYTRVFPVPDDAVTAHVVAQNRGHSGLAWVDELSVVGVARKNSFLWVNLTAGLIWIMVLILLIKVAGLGRLRYHGVVMGLIVLIVMGVALPQPWLKALVEKPKALITTLSPGADRSWSGPFCRGNRGFAIYP